MADIDEMEMEMDLAEEEEEEEDFGVWLRRARVAFDGLIDRYFERETQPAILSWDDVSDDSDDEEEADPYGIRAPIYRLKGNHEAALTEFASDLCRLLSEDNFSDDEREEGEGEGLISVPLIIRLSNGTLALFSSWKYLGFPQHVDSAFSKIVVNKKRVYRSCQFRVHDEGYQQLYIVGEIWLPQGHDIGQHPHSGDALLRFFLDDSFTTLGCCKPHNVTQTTELSSWFSDQMWRECLQSKNNVALKGVRPSVQQWKILGTLPLKLFIHEDESSPSWDFLQATKVSELTIPRWNDTVFAALATRDRKHPLPCLRVLTPYGQPRQLQHPGELDSLVRALHCIEKLIVYPCNLTQANVWDHFWHSIRDNNVLVSLKMEHDIDSLLITIQQLEVVYRCLTSNWFLHTIDIGPLTEEATTYWNENIQPLLDANREDCLRLSHPPSTLLDLFRPIEYVQHHPTKLYKLLREYPGVWSVAHKKVKCNIGDVILESLKVKKRRMNALT
jgi:hypothetical protein